MTADRGPATALAAALLALSVAVAAGWFLHIPGLVQVLPGLTGTVLNAALGFLLCSLSLLGFSTRRPVLRRGARAAAGSVLVLALLNGWQLFTGRALGIDLAPLQSWIVDGDRHPGRMAEPTTVGFALAGVSLLLLGMPRRPWRTAIGQTLAVLVALIGGAAIAGYALHIDALYHWYRFGRMALLTAAGMSLLGGALQAGWREPSRRLPDTRRIVLLAALSLIVVALLSGLSSAVWFRTQSESAMARVQRALLGSRAAQLSITLQGRSERAAIVTTRPLLETLLRRLAAGHGRHDARRMATADIAGLRPYGFSRIELRDGRGDVLVADGAPSLADAAEFPLQIPTPGEESLVWDGGFVLRDRRELVDDGRLLGTIVTEQPLPRLRAVFDPVSGAAAGDQVLICGVPRAGPPRVCLPVNGRGAVAPPPDELTLALDAAAGGAEGHLGYRDDHGVYRRVSYGPVGRTGLVIALTVPNEALYAPVRNALAYGVLLVLFVGGVAVRLLQLRVQPLAEKLARSEGRYALVARALHEGLLLLDEDGRVLATNEIGARQFGHTVDSLTGRMMTGQWPIFRDDGTPMTPAEYPGATALATGQPVTNQMIRLQAPDGGWRWIRVSAMPTGERGGERYAVVTFTDVTDERANAERMRVAERRFREIIDSVEDYAILMLDAEGRIATWNPGAERIQGYRADEAIGQSFSLFYPDEERARGKPQALLAQAAAQGHVTDEGWRQRRSGERFWASAVIYAVRDAHGRLTGYSKITRDLTERYRAEQALQESEETYRSLVMGVADGVVAVDARGIVLSLNPAAEALFGWPAAEVIGNNVSMLIPVRYRAAHDGYVARFAGGQEPALLGLRREVTGLRRDGGEFPVMLALNAAESRGRGRYVALLTDLTERHRAERALAEVHRRMRALVDSAPFSIIASDVLIDTFNPAAERLTHYRREEMIGQKVERLHLREEIEARALELSEQLGETVPAGPEVFTALPKRGIPDLHEWTYVRKDGSRVPVQLAVSELRDPEDSSVTGYMGIAYDISERRQREAYTRHLATHDFLTGLPNRLLLDDRLVGAERRARRHGDKLALMLLDLDHFKAVNDRYGHAVGDELLKVVAQRLLGCVRAVDTIARLGGDEFVVLIEEVCAAHDAEAIAAKIVTALAEPVPVGELRLQVSTSLGLAFYPDAADSIAALMRKADAAMYRAKAEGRGRYLVFGAEPGRDLGPPLR